MNILIHWNLKQLFVGWLIIRFKRIQRFTVNNLCGCLSLFETLRDLTSSGVDKLSIYSLVSRSLRSHSFWFPFPFIQRPTNVDLWLTRSELSFFFFFSDVNSFTFCFRVTIKTNEIEPNDLSTVRDEDFKNFYFGSVSFGKLSSCEELWWNGCSHFKKLRQIPMQTTTLTKIYFRNYRILNYIYCFICNSMSLCSKAIYSTTLAGK